MKICILMGSPRLEGNTATLLKPFVEELASSGAKIDYIQLANKNINDCIECHSCQKISDKPGCSIKDDDMEDIFASILDCDCLVLATPIFAFSWTGYMKKVLDRFFSFSKMHANSFLLEGKSLALITTCAYKTSESSDLMEIASKRICDFSHMIFKGHLSIRGTDVINDSSVKSAKNFAYEIIN